MTYTIRNLTTPSTTKEIDDVLGVAVLVKLGLRSLRPLDNICIEDEHGYIVSTEEQRKWVDAYMTTMR